jgi:hypothetical protein
VVSSRLENKVLIVPTIKLDHATALFFQNYESILFPHSSSRKGFLPSRKGVAFIL